MWHSTNNLKSASSLLLPFVLLVRKSYNLLETCASVFDTVHVSSVLNVNGVLLSAVVRGHRRSMFKAANWPVFRV